MMNSTHVNQLVTSVNVTHVRKVSPKNFTDVIEKFESLVGRADYSAIKKAVVDGNLDEVASEMEGQVKLMIFSKLDMGAGLPSLNDKNIRAVQYLVGNPAIATKMTGFNPGVALYVPLRVLIAQDIEGNTTFNYDQPSTLLAQFKNSDINQTGIYLDGLINSVSNESLQ
jgi:uncharacterized protein (DUF302 family)